MSTHRRGFLVMWAAGPFLLGLGVSLCSLLGDPAALAPSQWLHSLLLWAPGMAGRLHLSQAAVMRGVGPAASLLAPVSGGVWAWLGTLGLSSGRAAARASGAQLDTGG